MATRRRLIIDHKEVIRLYTEEKWSRNKIAKHFGFDKQVVKRVLLENNVKLEERPRGTPRSLVKKRFDRLLVLEFFNRDDKKRLTFWKCVCDCGNTTIVRIDKLTSRHTRSCGCIAMERSKNNKFVGDISGVMWGRITGNARKRGIPFTVTQTEAWELFKKQKGRCSLSGRELTLPTTNRRYVTADFTASFDRIDSKGSYCLDNVQWVHKHVNVMKMALEQNVFISACVDIANVAIEGDKINEQPRAFTFIC